MDYPIIEVCFILSGVNIDIDIITDKLCIKPTKVRRKEDFEIQEFATMSWQLKVAKETCKAIDIQFNKLLGLLKGKEKTIKELVDSYKLNSYFNITIHAEVGEEPEMVLPKDVIKFAGMVDAEIGLSVYIY